MDAGDSETPGSRAVTGKTPVMPIPSQYLKQYYAQAMGDNYSPPQEGPNMPYILTPAQQQLAGILQLKQQQQQQLEQQHGMHHPQLLQQQLIYLQQQQLLQQQQQHQHQHELNYRLEMQQHSLNGHHKQKKFGDHNNQSPMDHDKPIPPKPKIKVEPEDEPTQKEEEVLMDQDEDAANRMSKEDQSKSLSQPKPPHLPPVSSAASSSSSAQTAQELTSSAVKKKLQNFVLNKQQRELAVASLTNDSAFKHWSQNMDKEGDDLAPLGSHLDANHFPLRKTASEPNLKVKSRLKAKVAEHRTIGSPLLHRPHRNGNKLHRSMTLETTGNENADRSNPGSPTQSVSASPGRERSSPLGAPGSTFGHSLPNLQAIPRLSANIDRSHINQLMANRFIMNHQSLVSQGISNDAEYQSPYANELLYDSMEEDDDSSLNAAALKQVQYKNLALAKAQSKMLGLSGGHLLNSNSLLSRGQHSGLTGRGSPPSQNNLLSIPKSTLSPTPQASSLHHRPLRLTLSAPGYSISNNPQLQQQQQQILKHNQELLQQQQHLQFLQQQRFQQGQSRYLKQLQQDLLMQQLGKQNFPKVQQAEKEPRGSLKDHLEMLQFQKEQQEHAAKEREKAYQQHKKEQQLAQAARTTEDLPSPRALNEQQIQELLLLQQLQRQDPLQRGGLLQQQLLQHQQLLQLRQAEVQAAPSAASASPSASVGHRPLTRAISMPAVGSGQAATAATRTGIVYDTLMLKHQCSCGDTSSHPEHPGRLQSIWARLQETGVTNICERVRPRKATLAEILTVHSEQHTMLYGGSTQCRTKAEDGTITTLKCFNTLPCGGMGVDGDTIWNEIHSANAARMAVGCVVELAYKVAGRELKNGMAIVRPPGHHAEAHQAMGFCYFNNVAIAARLLRLKMSVERVLIVDWDIHHGNGTQQMFYDDPHVLYISIHRHDDETFFPGTGKSEECGAGIGVGYNVNIAWNGGLDPIYGDAEYLAAFRSVVMPIAKEFDPEIILVSAGFDAATGHSPQLGGYKVTAACFAQLTKQLMELADGHLVMSLEGGYSLPSLCDAAEACLRGLLTQELPEVPKESLTKPPNPNAVAVLEKTIAIQSRYWNSVKRTGSLINHSVVEAQQREKEELETVSALASLSMGVNVVQDSDKATDVQMEVQDES